MKVKSLELKNFRQYRDFFIEFDTSSEEKNVTVVRASNSTGKTTLMQSIMWCLYGDIAVDLGPPNKIINGSEIDKAKRNFHDELNYSVTIEIQNDNNLFKISRQQYLLTKSLNRREQFLRFEYLDDGETKILKARDRETEKVKKIEKRINSLMSRQMARYFLFDGERIEKLSNNTNEAKKEISNAITAVSSLPMIDNALSTLNNLRKEVRKEESTAIGSDEVKNIEEQLTANENDIKSEIQEKDELESKESEIASKLREIDEELSRYSNIKEHQQNRVRLEKLIKNQTEQKDKLKNSITTKHSKYQFKKSIFLLHKKFESMNLTKSESSKTIPQMSVNAIENILERKVCICGREIDEASALILEEQKNYQPPKSPESMIHNYEMSVKDEVGKIDETVESLRNDIEEYIRKTQDIYSYEEELHNINQILIDSEVEKIKNLNIQREELLDEKRKTNRAVGQLEESIKNLNDMNISLEHEFNKLKAENLKSDLILKRSSILNEAILQLEERNEKDRQKLRERIEFFANKHFSEIITKEKTITIDEGFSHKVLEKNGKEASPSSGEQVAVSISIILAIIDTHKESGKKGNRDDLYTERDFFLVMDGPFATLDPEYSYNIASKLVKTVEQIILLTNDNQYNESVISAIKDNISKEYILKLPTENERKNSLETKDLEEVN